MPSLGQVHVDRPLTNLAIVYRNPAFMAPEVFPIVPVIFESDKYYKYYREERRRIKTLRAMGAEAKEVEWTTTTGTYVAQEYALKKLVPDRLRANSDSPIRPEQVTLKKLLDWIDLDYEMRVQETVQATGNVYASATPSPKWDGTSPTIEKDIDTAKTSVRQQAGAGANTILMSPDVKDYVKRDSTLRSLIQYAVNSDVLLRNGDLPPVLFNLRVIVPGAVNDTANQGQTATMADVWNDNVLVAYVEPNPSLEALTLGFTMRVRQGGKLEKVVTTWRNQDRKGDFIEVSIIQAEEVCATECGYLITDSTQS
jgi:hypothetical protein